MRHLGLTRGGGAIGGGLNPEPSNSNIWTVTQVFSEAKYNPVNMYNRWTEERENAIEEAEEFSAAEITRRAEQDVVLFLGQTP